jgi:PBP1b-binding outer membrane lipoprotein LpoB
MKNIALVLLLMFALVGCTPKNDAKSSFLPAEEPPKPKFDQVRFPPPVVKPDNEVIENETDGNADASAEAKPQDVVLKLPPNQNVNKQVSDTTKKIIKEGTISFETSNLIKTRSTILKALQQLNGYLSEENQSNDNEDNRTEYNLKIRIPAQNFDRLLDTISAGADKIDAKNISITDVTANFIDELV